MSKRIEVCSIDELQDGDRIIRETPSGIEIAILNVDGEYYAIGNQCAHMGGPVAKGKVQGTLVGEYVEPCERVNEYFAEEPAIACPWHGWEYDLETGVHLGDETIRIPTFDVTVEEGSLFVEL